MKTTETPRITAVDAASMVRSLYRDSDLLRRRRKRHAVSRELASHNRRRENLRANERYSF